MASPVDTESGAFEHCVVGASVSAEAGCIWRKVVSARARLVLPSAPNNNGATEPVHAAEQALLSSVYCMGSTELESLRPIDCPGVSYSIR